MAPNASQRPKLPQKRTRRLPPFSRNLSDLIAALGLRNIQLSQTEIVIGGERWHPGRETIRRALNGVRQKRDTKAGIVQVLRQLRPRECGDLALPNLEQETFDVGRYARPSSLASGIRFDVDTLVDDLERSVREATSRAELLNRILAVPIEEAKREVAQRMRGAVSALQLNNREFNHILDRVGIPEGLPLADPRIRICDFAERIDANPASLPPHQQMLWRVASAMYPEPPAHTDQDLKAPLRYLAKYWDRSLLFAKERWRLSLVEDIGRTRPQWRPLVYLTSWLELRLAIETHDLSHGKSDLFALARWYMGTESRR